MGSSVDMARVALAFVLACVAACVAVAQAGDVAEMGPGVHPLEGSAGCDEEKLAQATKTICDQHGDAMCSMLRQHNAHRCPTVSAQGRSVGIKQSGMQSLSRISNELKQKAKGISNGQEDKLLKGHAEGDERTSDAVAVALGESMQYDDHETCATATAKVNKL